MEGSTKIIIDGVGGTVVNRLDYDHLGNLRNQTAPPQVEMLWRKGYDNIDLASGLLFNDGSLYYLSYIGLFFRIVDYDSLIERTLKDSDIQETTLIYLSSMLFKIQQDSGVPLLAGAADCFRQRHGNDSRLICHWPDCTEVKSNWVYDGDIHFQKWPYAEYISRGEKWWKRLF